MKNNFKYRAIYHTSLGFCVLWMTKIERFECQWSIEPDDLTASEVGQLLGGN